MNCQHARDTFPELLDHRTAASSSRQGGGAEDVHADARAHLANCPDCQREFAALSQTLAALAALEMPAPSPRLRENFHAMLEAEKHAATRGEISTGREHRDRRAAFWRWLPTPALACALLLLGFLGGARFGAATVPAASNPDAATRRELAALRNQVAKMSQLVGYSLLQQEQGPANERLREVLASANTDQPSNKVLDDLISALAFDPNANVRLRALEALYGHADNAVVRSGVVAALPREQNPLVQLEMIDFVAAAHDRDAAPALEKMSQSEATDRSVRAAALRAMAQW